MIISADRENVVFTEYENAVAGGTLNYLVTRTEFANHFGFAIPPEVFMLSYEPERALYHVVTGWDNVQSFATPGDHPLLQAIHNARDTIKAAAEQKYLDDQAAATALQTAANEKAQRIALELPSWAQVENVVHGISNLAEAKVVMLKIAKVVYWLARNKDT